VNHAEKIPILKTRGIPTARLSARRALKTVLRQNGFLTTLEAIVNARIALAAVAIKHQTKQRNVKIKAQKG